VEKMAQKKYTEERMIQYYGEHNAIKTMAFKGEQLNDNTSVMVEDKKVGRLGIGPTLSVGYTDKVVVVPGVGLQYSLFRF
jgi:hypothetical protein